MQLLAQEEYGLRCLLELARHDTKPRTIQQIASAEGLSPDYAAKLLRELRRGGLVESTRGAAGGYRLARSADTITAWDAVAAGTFGMNVVWINRYGQRRERLTHDPDVEVSAAV